MIAWKECPANAGGKYSINENPRLATKVDDSNSYCTIVGNTPFPPNRISSLNVKIIKSKNYDGKDIYVGVVPSDVNQGADCNFEKCGWYFYCFNSTLSSGPPHNHRNKIYGPRKEDGEYVYIKNPLGIVIDTTIGNLSFYVNETNYGIAYEGIPLDKPLFPCALLKNTNDSVELVLEEVKQNTVDSSFFVPSNIITREGDTCDSVFLTWDAIEGASLYQIEMDGSRTLDGSITNTFMKRGLSPDTGYTFRVRTAKGALVSEWSSAVEGRTSKAPIFSECTWRKCPDYVGKERIYYYDNKNPRIVTRVNHGDPYTAIGNIPILPNKVTSWNIKVNGVWHSDAECVYIGVAPSDINQDGRDNYKKCGWYINFFNLTLWSGPPHNYINKEYGPSKSISYYSRMVGVALDTTNGKLSFFLDGVNLGVAYEGIPLDRPLVPCATNSICQSVELDPSEVKEKSADGSVPVPSNIRMKSDSWDSISLIWDHVENAIFYQIEVYGTNLQSVATTNVFTKTGLREATEYIFRVRTVGWSSVSEWSYGLKKSTQKKIFENCVWKECPCYAREERKYALKEMNIRVAMKTGKVFGQRCTIIGNTFIPPDRVTTFGVKVLKSYLNNADNIYIGAAPFDIDQSANGNAKKCGWYFICYDSTLISGPPQNYDRKEYIPKKVGGLRIRKGNTVGVTVDTTVGSISFLVKGVDYGIAYKGIPLDKPLVPCVILGYEGDCVEIIADRERLFYGSDNSKGGECNIS